ncbi:MAG: hypothetical protein HYS81_02595 [Candidatus Aenigmatarchaeota archaeon]|nr:MAG: hypothetical protein HYS81_02595 [Candidatus Aenigmarchaeota archaeon]
MIRKEFAKQFAKDALMSFVYWTVMLPPYMLFVVKTTWDQYLAWVGMQAILVPPLGAVFSIIVRRTARR